MHDHTKGCEVDLQDLKQKSSSGRPPHQRRKNAKCSSQPPEDWRIHSKVKAWEAHCRLHCESVSESWRSVLQGRTMCTGRNLSWRNWTQCLKTGDKGQSSWKEKGQTSSFPFWFFPGYEPIHWCSPHPGRGAALPVQPRPQWPIDTLEFY